MEVLSNDSLLYMSSLFLFQVWDYFHPFPESRSVLIICVLGKFHNNSHQCFVPCFNPLVQKKSYFFGAAYFAMMVVLTFYTTYCEQGIFLEAVDIDPTGVDPTNKWILSSGTFTRILSHDCDYDDDGVRDDDFEGASTDS